MTPDELLAKLKERYPAIVWRIFDPKAGDGDPLLAVSLASTNILVTRRVTLKHGPYLMASIPFSRDHLEETWYDVPDYVATVVADALAKALLKAKPDQLEVK